tara:strand:+ start:472 stop:696 length:225 start_codon:yes stop_codon:yes gene_type:complete
MKEFKLDDTTIMQIVRLLQMGLLTGTDVADQLRTLRLSTKDDTNLLVPSPDYVEEFDENINKLVETAESATDTE